ncbi:2-phospho-L-lactate guanylyltransferase [Marinomonas sp. 15G1-11]|uniref:2-phospho-L-lactate guanylyltransferase n=1 Tax=Marinomonas phaeophyticola TaxID=3004091 RepID=A0ABT4JR85_9GAMM|nr:2-phospho-L-lactate guanylyltransferase [Marinomonas sp. 15G1-11]MCZ2720897.1 2-phospho-L-lactate guanylyltransferase [Marinomonas sp. 15G1-11]
MTLPCIVIPMKSPKKAKQRLSLHLSNEDRESLALTLFKKTLAFFNRHFPHIETLVVSESSEVLALAKTYGTHTLFDDGSQGLNGALKRACGWVKQAGFSQQLIIPSDIAILDKMEIESLLLSSEQASVVIALAKDGGTNALLTSPPDAIEFAYGTHSANKHKAQAVSKKMSCVCLQLSHLSLDIDLSDDLEKAIKQQPELFKKWCQPLASSLYKEALYA